MAHAADACDEALLPRARAATRDRPVTSGWSFAAVASATLALGGIASLALAVFSGTSSLGATARASLGAVRDGDPALRVPSAHRGGAKPPVFVVSSVDPGDDTAFEAFKRDVLLEALRAPPDFVARASWAGAASATRLPEKIERYEEACGVFEHGLATLTGTYVGQTHAWSDPRGAPFFELDDGKKMTVARRVVSANLALAPAFGATTDAREEARDEEISEPEKRAVGDAVGGAVSHLLAWRRARASGGATGATPGGGAVVADAGAFRLVGESAGAEKRLTGASFVSALDAVTAYRPRDADVVFLDVDGDALAAKAPAETLKRGAARGADVSFYPHDGSVSASGGTETPPLNPALYFVTETFLATFPDHVQRGGFGFVAAYLREKCADGSLTCYATHPRLAARRRGRAA